MKRTISTLIIILITIIILPQAMADLNDDLVAYWPFNGNANDESGNGNDGAVFGATLCEDRFGNMDSAYCFDGVDDYINIGNNVKPPFPVSVSVWVNAKDLDANDCGLAGVVRNDQYDDGSYRYGLTVRVSNGYLWAHYFEGFSAPWNRITYRSNDTLISADIWYHLVVIFNAHRDIHLFVNGEEYFGIYAGTGSGMSYSGSGNGAIGQFRTNVSRPGQPTRRTCYFNGIVDDLRIYNRALSNSEILDLFNEKCGFADVAPGSNHDESICAIYNAGITTGCSQNPLRFCPQDPVTRAQMAAFIVRAKEGEPPTDYCAAGSPFPDVDSNLNVCKYIKRLSELGITTGYGDGTYRPYNNVTRAQMAAFIVRAKEGEPPSDYCDTGSPFPDVDPNSPTCKYIKRFFELGITTGYPDGTYRPRNNVIRRQMAAFLDRAFLQTD